MNYAMDLGRRLVVCDDVGVSAQGFESGAKVGRARRRGLDRRHDGAARNGIEDQPEAVAWPCVV